MNMSHAANIITCPNCGKVYCTECHFGGCPACIEYKPERIRCDNNICKDWNNNYCWSEQGCHLKQAVKYEPQKLYILPGRKMIKTPIPCDAGKCIKTTPFDCDNCVVDAVYTQAKLIDIDSLAGHIWKYILKNGLLLSVDKDYIKQAIEDYIGGIK